MAFVVCIDDERSAMSLLGGAHLRAFAEHDARAMEAATRAMEEVSKRMEEASRAAALATAHSAGAGGVTGGSGAAGHHPGPTTAKYVDVTAPPCKRPALFDDEHRFLTHLGVPTARLKMTTQSALYFNSSYCSHGRRSPEKCTGDPFPSSTPSFPLPSP